MELRGFDGRVLRRPPWVAGVFLSLSSLIWIPCVLGIAWLPAFLVKRMEGGQRASEVALALGIVTLVASGKMATRMVSYYRFRYLQHRFSILALRRFHSQAMAYLYRNLVAPAVGCYGIVTTVADESLRSGERRARDASLLDVAAFGDPQVALTIADRGWTQQVAGLIATSDLAVIDLTQPTVQLLWEAACCLELLPAHRVIVVGIQGTPWAEVLQLLCDRIGTSHPSRLAAVRSLRPIEYSGRPFATLAFRIRLLRKMQGIAKLDEEVRS